MTDHSYRLDDYDYDLPADLIAQFPAPQRDQSRLLVLATQNPSPAHRRFADLIDYLRAGDLLVLNTTKVFPARLLGSKQTGGKVELFLLALPRPAVASDADPTWHQATATALIKSSKRPKKGSLLSFGPRFRARIDDLHPDGKAEVTLQYRPEQEQSLEQVLELHGQMPLPPYISRPDGSLGEDRDRYQTRYARQTGSVAAPTAGLHFSDELLAAIRSKGVELATIVLHVGYGTFAPVRSEDIRDHAIHREYVEIPPAAAEAIHRTKQAGGRVWAVGTTTVRTLEFAADEQGLIRAGRGECDLFIYPGYRFRVVDNLITNFHLPKSSLLFLVAALAGRNRIMATYREAVMAGYRFFSYGDAMAIVTR
ncbi:MAG: tRNA preQ1(34) S-adenosylmethionine ribosyltransferase-isomerase QueA [Desulfobulbus sp.]|jgi:S-adenosylmethionine:tRNA ribosyltransferase-isomerase|uniref:tRNA preQ1(34) S-adenosylmethionine ribosyltransferase-isomerase QueA n=1 Tax=Desulfobulbus sp. TaxID=895 RepID=UPI00283FA952|nr:tRNA preQ1(34) S-adenosylmethionine ribosyltransferase-isomerase QueA [Desulfobulbus sp.]MDR2550707.1 tRNA preQ1(34) S-adenosylmethionine ribosyltransferase-isomerase QueA [Desulfobulbus sp.]